jgi:hypothetical protein
MLITALMIAGDHRRRDRSGNEIGRTPLLTQE